MGNWKEVKLKRARLTPFRNLEDRVSILEKQVQALDKLYKNIQDTIIETGATLEEPGQ